VHDESPITRPNLIAGVKTRRLTAGISASALNHK